jgi:UDP-N-acetyl-2-amino-2-deoxyglucuronate dehydrogenase
MQLGDEKMKQNRLNVGIVGCGFIAEEHVKAWRNVGANIISICDKDASLLKSKAEKWGVKSCYDDVKAMAANEKLDAVSVCTSANVRSVVVEPLLEKGISVVVEKPFAMSVIEAEKMVASQRKYGAKLTVVHNWLFSYLMQKILLVLERKELGDLLSVELELLHTKDDQMAANPSHWCHAIEAGRFGELLPHTVYILRRILGNIEVKYIFGSKLGSYSWMPIDELRLLFANSAGKTASAYITFNSPRMETTLRIVGTKGVLLSNLSTDMVVKRKYGEISVSQIISEDMHLLKEHLSTRVSIESSVLRGKYKSTHTEFMKAFKKCLLSNLSNTPPPVTAEEALAVVKMHKELCTQISEKYFVK